MTDIQDALARFRYGVEKLWEEIKADADGDGVPDALEKLDEIARGIKRVWDFLTPEQKAVVESWILRLLLKV